MKIPQKKLHNNSLEDRIRLIESRNHHVEADKAWEISYTRALTLFVITLILFKYYFQFAEIEKPWLNAIVPALAFVLAPLSLPPFKRLWLKYIYKSR